MDTISPERSELTASGMLSDASTSLPILSPQYEVDPDFKDENVPPQCAGTSRWFQIRQKSPWALLYAALLAGVIYGLFLIVIAIVVVALALWLPWPLYNSIKDNNTHTRTYKYRALLQQLEDIRLLQILPGTSSNTIRCTFVTEKLGKSVFEALSYCWTSSGFPKTISVDDQEFKVTSDLHRALSCLRSSQSIRTVWIDAICINQSDLKEKSQQVQRMRDIYKTAERVIVWLSLPPSFESENIEETFAHVKRFASQSSLNSDSYDAIFHSKRWKACLSYLFKCGWWERVWIVQEVAVAQQVMVQCREHTIDWEDICKVIKNKKMQSYLRIPDAVHQFIDGLTYFQDTPYDPSYGLLSLTYKFRHRKATIAHDKVYALRGLIKTAAHAPKYDVDYTLPLADFWVTFTKECIKAYRTLIPIALADAFDFRLNATTWCHWSRYSYQWLEQRQPLWTGGVESTASFPLRGNYSAAGGALSITQTDLADTGAISIKGFIFDEIVAIGPSAKVYGKKEEKDWKRLIPRWERLAGGPWQGDDEHLNSVFHQTLTAGNWTEQPSDWRYWVDGESNKIDSDLLQRYRKLRNAACSGRRIFITARNHFGLGHSHARIGELICVLLGSDVPLILGESPKFHMDTRSSVDLLVPWINSHSFKLQSSRLYDHFYCCVPKGHTFVGQAYVHEIMQYKGNILEDIKSKKVILRDFVLR